MGGALRGARTQIYEVEVEGYERTPLHALFTRRKGDKSVTSYVTTTLFSASNSVEQRCGNEATYAEIDSRITSHAWRPCRPQDPSLDPSENRLWARPKQRALNGH